MLAVLLGGAGAVTWRNADSVGTDAADQAGRAHLSAAFAAGRGRRIRSGEATEWGIWSGCPGTPKTGWSARVVDAWGHLAPEILCTSIVAAILVGLRPPGGLLALTLPISLMALVVTSWLLMRRHDRRLCELCAAAMPLNAAENGRCTIAGGSGWRTPAPSGASSSRTWPC